MSETPEDKVETSALYEDIVRDIKFTEAQSSQLDYYRKEQWAIEREARRETLGGIRMFFVLILAQTILLVTSSVLLNLRVERIEKWMRQEQKTQIQEEIPQGVSRDTPTAPPA